jgi:hypothetical protein
MYRPAIQVRSNMLVKYDVWTGPSIHQRFNFREAIRQQYEGTLTAHARKRLMSAVDILIQRNPTRKIYNPISQTEHDFSINFTTLTIASPRLVSAREAYDVLLSRYLRYMRDKYDVREYVWKAELQERGQIHYHLLTNQFIPWQVIKWKWNSLQKQAGLLDDWARQHKNFNPNSTDIHTVEKEEGVLEYISKEIGKTNFYSLANGSAASGVWWDNYAKVYVGNWQDGGEKGQWHYGEWDGDRKCITSAREGMELVEPKLNGKIWDASDALKISRFADEMDDETWSRIAQGKRDGKIKEVAVERCEVFKMAKPLQYLSNNMLKNYREYLSN